jgi:hypothetical protein
VAYDGTHTLLVLKGGQAVRATDTELRLIPVKEGAYEILSEYPVKRWIELQTVENSGKVIPRSVKVVLERLGADPALEYTRETFTRKHIMATKKEPAADKATADKAPATDAKKANAAKAPAKEKAAPAAKKTAEKPAAKGKDAAPAAKAPAKQPAKAAKEPSGEEGRRGRPSPYAADAVVKKGKVDFKEHIREGTHRFSRTEFLVKNVGKKIGDLLGQEFEPGYALASKHVGAAIEAGYIELSK